MTMPVLNRSYKAMITIGMLHSALKLEKYYNENQKHVKIFSKYVDFLKPLQDNQYKNFPKLHFFQILEPYALNTLYVFTLHHQE